MDVTSTCPFCSGQETNPISVKDTIVCRSCSRPFEVYEDGRVEKSMLYEVVGHVRAVHRYDRNVCTGFGLRGDHVQTRLDDTQPRWWLRKER